MLTAVVHGNDLPPAEYVTPRASADRQAPLTPAAPPAAAATALHVPIPVTASGGDNGARGQ